jgi:hypothetical protein
MSLAVVFFIEKISPLSTVLMAGRYGKLNEAKPNGFNSLSVS